MSNYWFFTCKIGVDWHKNGGRLVNFHHRSLFKGLNYSLPNMELKFWWPHSKFVPPSWLKMPVNYSFVLYGWVGWGGWVRSHLKSFHSEYSLWGYIKNFIVLSHFQSTTVWMQPHPPNSLCYAYLGKSPRWSIISIILRIWITVNRGVAVDLIG